ncbi:phosphoketolase, partial [Pseudomonas sp. SIMBA_068]
ETWMRSYQPDDLFDEQGRLKPELQALAPEGDKRMGSSPYANGGLLRRELDAPELAEFACDVSEPGAQMAQATEHLGRYLS